MVFLIWVYLMIFLKPEKSVIPGLKDKVKTMIKELRPITGQEKFLIICFIAVIVVMSLQSFVPVL